MIGSKKKMLITGVSGLLGSNLAYYFRDKYDVLGLYHSHSVIIEGIQTRKIDLLTKDSVHKVFESFLPHILIHCASITDVEFCESHPELTELVNVFGTRAIVDAVKETETKLIYISTDSVYDGKSGNYSETDLTNPLNFYGISKLKGEQETDKKTLILRTNIFGWNIQEKQSLAEWILGELSEQKAIGGFRDAYFSSIYTFDFAKILELAIEHDLEGVYNCGSNSTLSKYEFALQIAELFNLDKSLIKPISLDEFSFKAKRGSNLSLNLTKLIEALNITPPKITESLENFYNDFHQGLPQKIKRNSQYKMIYPQLDFIPYGRQGIDDEDIQAVVKVLQSPYLTQGPKIAEFEAALCQTTGARFAVAVNSGTSALHIACLAAGIGSNSEVITSANTFVASANSIVYCGGKPIFADIDSKTYNISPETIDPKIEKNCHAIIPVHFAGQSCFMGPIREVIERKEREFGHKIYIIEDASHALGSSYRGKPVGACTYSDMAIMSFHPVKHITTGEGGVVLTNNEELYRKLKLFRSHGITSDPKLFVNRDIAFAQVDSESNEEANPWYYEQIGLGYNYRITDIQCALGLSQISKLEHFRARRFEIVRHFNKAFSNLPGITTPFQDEENDSNFHLYVLLFDFEKIGISRAKLMRDLRKDKIITQVHYIPVYKHPYYQKNFNTKNNELSNTEKYYASCLSLPLYPTMSNQDIDRVVHAIQSKILKKT